jgi:hypothetical protein
MPFAVDPLNSCLTNFRKENFMEKMQEAEFDKIEFCNKSKPCNHKVVKLYDLGAHSDYGCVLCGRRSLIKEDFTSHKE